MRPLVVDASVAVKWVVDEPDSDAALRVLRECDVLHAPAHWLAEAATALWAKAAVHHVLSRSESLARIEFLARLPIRITPLHEIVVRAGDIAHELALTVYDTLYVVLAERLDLAFVTADRKLFNAASRATATAGIVHWIGAERS